MSEQGAEKGADVRKPPNWPTGGIDSQSQLDEVERMAAIGSWVADLVNNRTHWSDELFRICGFEPQSFEPDYHRYLETIHPDDRERVRADIERAVADPKPYRHEYRIVRPDGSERFCLAHGDVYTDENGALIRLAGTCQDITERKAVEAQIALQRAQLEEAQRIAKIGSWNWDLRTGEILWSDKLSHIFGTEQAAYERTLEGSTQAVHPDDRELIQRVVAQVLETHEPVSYDFRVLRPDGEVRYCRARVNLFTDEAGNPVRMAGTAQDITESKVMEEELFRATAAKAAAEGANLAKGQFLASMSHELRTPLNSVIGFANVLLKNKSGNLAATELQYLERIRYNGQHLLELINDILDLSKIELGKMEVENETFSLVALVKETIADLRGAVRDGTELRGIFPDAVAPFTSDPRKVKQILINLVGNALKFTEKGAVTVELFVDPETRQARRVEVRDTGVGIPPDRLEAIFLAFEQADRGTGRRFGGTGLGLAIVSSLSELLGFEVEVESQPDVGSTFRVIFPSLSAAPVRPARDAAAPGAVSTPAEGAAQTTAARPMTGRSPIVFPTDGLNLDGRLVLVIDDDTDSRILLTQNLEESGARTMTASSGEHGIRMAREFRPDIITLDMLLPGMSGWETLAALKSDPDLCGIPVVIVSVVGKENPAAVVGAAEVIEKPINREELVTTLRRALGEQPRRILIVDDAADSRDLLRSFLEDESVEIRTASDGVEALEMIDEFAPDLVLLDLVMPNLDGIAIIQKLNEREPYLNIPIVVVTARDLSGEEKRELNRSCLAVLRKGTQLEEELRGALKGVL